jgi:hypothetical protein
MTTLNPRSFLNEPILLEHGFRLVTKDPKHIFAYDIEAKPYKYSTIYLTQHDYVAYNRRIYYYTAFRINSYAKRPTDVAFYDEFELRNVRNLHNFLLYLKEMAGF